MATIRQNALRKIAESELGRRLSGLDTRARQDLATSLVRQWITNDGHAGLVTPSGHYWFRMIRTPDGGFRVGFEAHPPRFVEVLRGADVAEDRIPDLLYELSVRQVVPCETQTGKSICVRMIAAEKTLRIEPPAPDEE
jgi:hypothetical protein